jgi:transcriptional regulator with XRE-family HTH domain
MPVMKMMPEEIRILRKTLKMSEAELAERIELEDRQLVKQIESGAMKTTPRMNKLLLKLLTAGAARSPKLKKVLEAMKERSEVEWRIK